MDATMPHRDDGIWARIPGSLEDYLEWHAETVRNRRALWAARANLLQWEAPWRAVCPENPGDWEAPWFSGGRISAIGNLVLRWHERSPGTPALVFRGASGQAQSVTYGELADRISGLAAGLLDTGLSREGRVAVVMDNSLESLLLVLAGLHAGCTVVPLSRSLNEGALTRRLLHVSASVIYTGHVAVDRSHIEQGTGKTAIWLSRDGANGSTAIGRLQEHGTSDPPLPPAVLDADAPMLWVYANAAASRPRAALFRAGGFLTQACSTHEYLFGRHTEPNGTARLVCAVDLATSFGLAHGLIGPLASGWTVELPAEPRDPNCLPSNGAQVLLASPDALRSLLGTEGRLPRFAQVANLGGMLRPILAARCIERFLDAPEGLTNIWAQTETGVGLIASFPDAELHRTAALGLPLPGIEPDILDDLGRPCGTNESGLLVFRSPWPALGCPVPGQEDRYRNLLFGPVRGKFATRDGVRRDPDGFFWYMRRLDDTVTVEGVRVKTSEVEAVLAQQESVSEAAVVPLETAQGGRLAAFVVLEDPASEPSVERELRRAVREEMGPQAVPALFVAVPELPRTPSGKVVRRLLRRALTGDINPGEDLSHLRNPGVVEHLIAALGKRP